MQISERVDYFTSLPEFKELANNKIAEFNSDIASDKKLLDEYYELRKTQTDIIKCVVDGFIEQANAHIKWCEGQKKRFAFLITKASGYEIKGGFNIEEIKTYPIGDIMPTKKFFENDRLAKYLCPLHNEKTASFNWYKKTNSFYCYGCCVGGSNVDLQMKLYNQTFKEACKTLSNSS